MAVNYRVALCAAVLAMAATAAVVTVAMADGIDPGLWKVITRTETGGVIGPPHESLKCLTADQTRDLSLGTGLFGDRCARPACTHRKPLKQAGGDVGRADPDHLSVAVDLVARAGG